MLFLLESPIESPIEIVDLYLEPLRKYIASTVKLEDQIRGRRAIWLIEVKSYLLTKYNFEQRMDRLIEINISEEKTMKL